MDKIDSFEYCNFKIHINDKFNYTHYCYNCKLRLCSSCFELHEKNSNYSNHSLEKITTDLQRVKLLIGEVERDKRIKAFYEKEKNDTINFANSQLNEFTNLMLKTNNKFSEMFSDYIKKYNVVESIKNNIEKRLGDEKFNFITEVKIFDEKYDEAYIKMKSIDEIYNFTMNYIIEMQNENRNNNNNSFKIVQYNYINKTIIHKKEIIKNNNINEISLNKEKNIINLNKQDSKKLFEGKNENLKLRESKITKNCYINELNIEEEVFQAQNNNKSYLKINLNKDKAINNSFSYINRKKDRDYNSNNENNNVKESKFTFGDNAIKKRKLEDICINQKIDNDKSLINLGKEKIIFQQVKNYKTNVNNIYLGNNNISTNKKEVQDKSNDNITLFNFKLNREGEVSISLSVNNGNVFLIKYIGANDIIFENPYYKDKFPYFGSRLININNKAFVIGGKNIADQIFVGNKLVFKLEYINTTKFEDSSEIKCTSLKEMIFEHIFHHLIYSEVYNIIFVISGRNQRKCEYGILDKNIEKIIEWKEMDSVLKPKENDLCFLLNDKYIFLLGEKTGMQYNYEVFDISNISKKGKWKSYSFIPNNTNVGIFGIKIPGIIEVKDNVYVLGGYQHGIGNNLNWKINFTTDSRDKEDNEFKRIDSIIYLKSDKIQNYDGILSFYGQQKFIKLQDSFANLNILGKHVKFTKSQLDEKLY